MTRDEQRATCIEAIAHMISPAKYFRGTIIRKAERVLDALHGLARVNTIEATEEMIAVGCKHRDTSQGGLGETFDVMSAAGDLTEPPETNP